MRLPGWKYSPLGNYREQSMIVWRLRPGIFLGNVIGLLVGAVLSLILLGLVGFYARLAWLALRFGWELL